MVGFWWIYIDINLWFIIIDWIIERNFYLVFYVSLGYYNDMDMFEVGRGFMEDEEKIYFGIWFILFFLLMIGCDFCIIFEKILLIIINKEVIVLN